MASGFPCGMRASNSCDLVATSVDKYCLSDKSVTFIIRSSVNVSLVGSLPAPLDELLVGLTHDAADELHLLHGVAARKQRRTRDQLRHDAPHGPHVDRSGVSRPTNDHLRGAVPASGDVVGQDSGVVVVFAVVHTRQTEVGQLQATVCVHQYISRPEESAQ